MLAFLNDIVDHRLLPDRLKRDDLSMHRARVLAWVHLIAIFISGVLSVVAFYIIPDQVIPISICNLASIALTYAYKRFGNHVVSGNLLVAVLFGVLMSGMMSTGGFYSDNLLWMLLVPITAYLFTTRKWGLAWTLVVISLIFVLYLVESNAVNSYRVSSLGLSLEYFLVSYVGLFVTLIGVVTIFVGGNEGLLDSLHKTSEKLRARSAELEAKNDLLRKQEKELTRSNRDLEFFAYVASHDLKEPLRMINVYAKMLDKSLNGAMTERDHEFMSYIKEGGTRMQTMLEDLLAYGKLGRENKVEEPVDFKRIILIVENNLKLRLIETGGSIKWNKLPILRGRSTHIVQLLQNLIANSLKFSREGIPPVIEISSHQNDTELVIRLTDNGIGISNKDIDNIFGVFQRLGNSSKFEGSGIGLATVDRIMEGLGGSINVESELGLGTTFNLSFPIERLIVARESEAIKSYN